MNFIIVNVEKVQKRQNVKLCRDNFLSYSVIRGGTQRKEHIYRKLYFAHA